MLQKYSTWKVLKAFFNDPEPETLGLTLREISRKSELAHTSVKRHLQDLKNAGLVEIRQKQSGSRTYPVYRANRGSEKFKRYKVIDTLHRIWECNLIDKLVRKTAPDCIILFGSAARGEDLRDSDVDLYIQSSEKEIDLQEYEDFLKRPIQLHFQPQFRSYTPELKNNIINGIPLYGYLSVFGG